MDIHQPDDLPFPQALPEFQGLFAVITLQTPYEAANRYEASRGFMVARRPDNGIVLGEM